MRTRETFREHPSVIPTVTPRPWSVVAWQAFATVAVVALLGWVGSLDDADRERTAAAEKEQRNELRNAWETGRQVGHQEAAQIALTQLREAYQGGLDDGRERCPVVKP